MMEQLKNDSDNLQRVCSPYRRRAATFYEGDLCRCAHCHVGQTPLSIPGRATAAILAPVVK